MKNIVNLLFTSWSNTDRWTYHTYVVFLFCQWWYVQSSSDMGSVSFRRNQSISWRYILWCTNHCCHGRIRILQGNLIVLENFPILSPKLVLAHAEDVSRLKIVLNANQDDASLLQVLSVLSQKYDLWLKKGALKHARKGIRSMFFAVYD